MTGKCWGEKETERETERFLSDYRKRDREVFE